MGKIDYLYALLLAAVAVAAGVFLFLQIGQPLVADEPQFVDVAYSLSRVAEPMGFSGSEWNPVLSHPLLYHSLVAVPVGLAGKVPWAGRLVGVLCFYAAGVVLWQVARRATGERWGPFVAVLLYALHPLAVQSALLVEIDTAVLPLLAIAKLNVRQVMGFTIVAFVIGLVVLGATTLIAPYVI